MKRLINSVVFLLIFCSAFGQRSIDDLFNRYSGKEGYTTITLSGDLIKWATRGNSERENQGNLPERLTEIRLLAAKDELENAPDFYTSAMRGLSLKSYEELVRVKEHDQDILVLVKPERNGFSELIVIAGGEENFIMQMKGFITRAEARKLSSEVRDSKSTINFSASF